MNSLTKLFSYSLFFAFLVSCSSTKPLTMDMALEQGTSFDYSITTTNNTAMSVMGQDMSTTGEATQDYNFMVKAVQPTGVTDIDFKISRMALDLKIPMAGDMSYDSAKGEADKDSPFSSLAGLIGKTMTASLDKRGTVTSVEGADALFKQVLGKIKGGEQVAQMLEGYIGEEAFKTSFSSLTGFSQGRVLKVGDSWTKNIKSESGVGLNSDYTYTIRERKDSKVTIDVTGDAKSNPNVKPIEVQGMKISYNLSGPINGVIVVDEKTGWALTSDIQQDLSGKLTISGTPMGDMNLDAKMKVGVAAKKK